MKKFCFLLALVSFTLTAIAQICGTPGQDGSGNSSNSINTYFPVAGNVTLNAGSRTVMLARVPDEDIHQNNFGTIPISAGDMLLLIQMQDATINATNDVQYGAGNVSAGPDNLGGSGFTDLGNTGVFEYVIATNAVSILGGNLTFRGAGTNRGTVNSYFNAAETSTRGKRTFQVVRIPQYSNLVLSSNIKTPPFNGVAGGIIAFDVSGTMDFAGFTIDASARGFRGGYGKAGENSGSNLNSLYVTTSNDDRSVGKGEGVAGTPKYMWDGYNAVTNATEGLPGGSYGRGAPGNAGGGGNDHNAGGGGGGNGGYGGVGGIGWEDGNGTFPNGGRPGYKSYISTTPNVAHLIMGGGGGGGDANNLDQNNPTNQGVKGGVGGGIILINVGRIIGVGTILCNGGNGQIGATGDQPDGAGGGGAGGTVYIKVSNPDPSAVLTIEAKGGNGGSTADAGKPPHGPGGGGGGGEIFYAMSPGTVNRSVSKGNAGKTESGTGILHGASDGTDGNVIPFLIASLPAYLRGGGSACFPELTTTLFEVNPAVNKYPGSTVHYTIKTHNFPAGGNAGGVQVQVQLPAGILYKSATVTESGGPATLINLGTASKPMFGDFNIAPGDDVLINLVAEVGCSQNPRTYSANAQSLYLDPSRTFNDPNRRITSPIGSFSNSNLITNITYETLSTPVPGGNFDGNTSIIDNVVVQAPTVLANNNINIPNSQIKFCVASVGDVANPGLITGSLPTGDTNEYIYQWRMSADNITFQDIPSATDINYNPGAISTTAYFRRLVKGHCTPQPLTSNTIKIEVNVKPVANFETPDFCLADGTAIFNNLSTIADGSANQLTYLWNFGDPNSGASNTSTQKNGSHSYSVRGDYVVTLTVTSKNACISDIKILPFTVNGSIPKANFKVRNEFKLCSGNAVEFDDLATVDFGQITKIEWYFDYINNPTDVLVDNSPGLRASTRPPYSKQYPVFTSAATKKYTIRMVAYSGASCVNSKDYEITLNAMPIVEFNAISPVCVNQQSFLLTQGTETTGIAGQGIYSGSGVSPSGFFDPALAGSGTHIITYTFRSTAGDCGNFKTQQVTVHPTPIVSNTSIEILEGGAVVLPAITSETGLSYQWTASNTLSQTNILRPLANPTESITYTLTATDKVTGCSSVGKIEVLVHKIPEIPNTFTPNGDGINDFWIIGYLGTYTDCTVNVFNRNGSLVFKSVGYASPWDGYYNGVELNSGTYFYIIDPKIGRKPMAGSVTIIR